MTYNWYNILNLDEFNDLGLTSIEVTANLEDIGEKTMLVTKGDLVSVLYDDVFLSCNLNDRNPFSFGSMAIYCDEDNELWIGFAIEN